MQPENIIIRVRLIRTSDIGNIGAKLNVEESVASVCRYRSWENDKCKKLQHNLLLSLALAGCGQILQFQLELCQYATLTQYAEHWPRPVTQ